MQSPRAPLRSILLAALLTVLFAPGLQAAEVSGEHPAAANSDSKTLTGIIFAPGRDPKRILYTFKRTETQSGSLTHALREYNYPDGTAAARETVTYDNGKLLSYDLEELQIDAHGRVNIRSDPADHGKQKIFFEYVNGNGANARRHVNSEELQSDTIVNDNIVPFLFAHWNALMKGEKIKFRYVVIPRTETIGFKLTKDEETTWKKIPVVIVKMAPANFIIGALVNPVYFTIEKEGGHRVFQYTGRTTPKIKEDGQWKDLDAVTVFDSN